MVASITLNARLFSSSSKLKIKTLILKNSHKID